MPEKEKEELEDEIEEEEKEEGAAEPVESKPGFFTGIKAKLSKVLGYLIGGILVVLISIGSSMYVSKLLSQKEKVHEVGGKWVIPPPPPYDTMDLGEFTVNITSDDDESHFMRVTIFLAYKERELNLQAELSKRRIQLQDKMNKIIARKTKTDLSTPEGLESLQIEIKEQINQILQSGKIEDVYFQGVALM